MASILVAEHNKIVVDALAECIQACHACNYRCCEGSERMGECGRSCVDCATVCEFTLTLLSRDSRWAAQACQLCAEICTTCAAECDKFDDEYCQRCAKACRACAQRCLQKVV
jgi:hypothetical protein